MKVRIDNTQAQKFVERGWSPTMVHMHRVYGVNVLWVTERIQEGLMSAVYEPTARMLADPLTKLRDSLQYFERGVMCCIPFSLINQEKEK